MKALTLKQPWADQIMTGAKTIETRTWSTKYRGPLVIHAAAKPKGDFVTSAILGIVDLADCRLMTVDDEDEAMCSVTFARYAWLLGFVYKFRKPISCKGALSLWSVPHDKLMRLAVEIMTSDKVEPLHKPRT